MAAPSRKLYIGVLVAFLLFIPAGLLLYHFGPAMVESWRWRHLGGPMETRGRFAGCVVTGGWGADRLLLDASGKVLRRWDNTCETAVVALDNGNVLFGSLGRVWEIDREGREIWRLPESAGLGWVSDVQRLASGTTLVAAQRTERDAVSHPVLEFTPAGKEVWRYKCDGYPQSVQRLVSGNTLICLWDKGAVEITRAGETVWKYERRGCSSARRLANGNTLLASASEGRVVEVDRAGEVVWEHKCENPVGAERLPDGRTLISSCRRPPMPSAVGPPLVRIIHVSPDGEYELLFNGPGGRAGAGYEGR